MKGLILSCVALAAMVFQASCVDPAQAGQIPPQPIPYVAPGSDNNVLTSNGTAWVSEAPAAAGITGTLVSGKIPYATGAGTVATSGINGEDGMYFFSGTRQAHFCGGTGVCNPQNGDQGTESSLFVGAGLNDTVDRFIVVSSNVDAGIRLIADRNNSGADTAYLLMSQDNACATTTCAGTSQLGTVQTAGQLPFEASGTCTGSLATATVLTTVSTTSLQFGSNSAIETTIDSNGLRGTPPAAQTIADTNTVTADACGTIKQISSAGSVTTNTTDTFTAPAAGNAGCCMDVVNSGANQITLDANAKFLSAGAANVVLGTGDTVRVCSDGASFWYMIGDKGDN